jgi:sugar lactone lactonase YvrE
MRSVAAGLALALGLIPALPLGAASTRLSTTASAREFLAGDLDGTTLTSDGRLTLGPVFTPRTWPEEAAGAVVFGAASDTSGRVYVATGGGLGRLFVSEPDGTVRVLFEAQEPNVTAVAVGPGGEVVCGTSPGGRRWRVDSKSKEPAKSGTPAGETGEAAVWSLAFAADGTVFAGTGAKGRIWKAGRDGKASLHAEVEDSHVRSLLVLDDGTLVAGTSDHGLVVAIAPDGKVRTLHDFARPEVTALALGPGGAVLAVATSVEVPQLSQQRSEPRSATVPTASSAGTPGPAQDQVPQGTVSVSATTSPVRPSAASAVSREGSAEVVVIAPDGFVEPAWILPEETVYGARWDEGRGALLLATGPRGRVYSLKDRGLRLEAQVDQKQVVSTPAVPGGFAVVAATSPGVLRPAAGKAVGKGSYLSSVRDAGRLARSGSLRFEGTVPKGSAVVLSARSGNSEKPDGTWSDWVRPGPSGAFNAPSARYFQWRAELSAASPGEAPVVERVEMSWAERNSRPIVENVTVLEPGAVFPRSGATSGAAVLSVTNPDENGAFAGLESPKEGTEATGKKLFRKGFRTVTWKGTDPNGDSLRYDLEVRRDGSPSWFAIRRDSEDSFVSFDTTPLPDGRYRFRVTASDRTSNAEGEALAATEESDLALVDGTPPVLTVTERRTVGDRVLLRVKAVDALSPLSRAEGTVSADRWRPLAASDGALDGREEELTLSVPKPAGPSFLAIRVVDASGNSSSVSAEYPGEFR